MPIDPAEQQSMVDKIMELFQSNEASIDYGNDPSTWVEENLPDGAEAADVALCMPEVASRMGGPYQSNAAHYNATHGAHAHAATSTVVNELSYNYNTVYQQNAFIHAEPGAQVTNIQGNGNSVTQTQIDGQFEPMPPEPYPGDMIVVEGDMAMTREQFIEEYGEGALSYVDPDGNFEVPDGYTHIDGGLVDPGGHLINDDGTQGPPVYLADGEEGGYEEIGEGEYEDGGEPAEGEEYEDGEELDDGGDPGAEGTEGDGEGEVAEPEGEDFEEEFEELDPEPEPAGETFEEVAPDAPEVPDADPMDGVDV